MVALGEERVLCARAPVEIKGWVADRRRLAVPRTSSLRNNRMGCIPAFSLWQLCSHLDRSQLGHCAF